MFTTTLIYAVALGVTAIGQNVINSASAEYQYVVTEEDPVGSVVADLVSDAGLRQTLDDAVLDSLVFAVFHGRHSELFDVDSPSGTVRVKQVIDRDVICYKLPTCIVPLDVAIIRPSAHFQVCAPIIHVSRGHKIVTSDVLSSQISLLYLTIMLEAENCRLTAKISDVRSFILTDRPIIL